MASQPRGMVWAERAVVALILASLAGAVNLVISIHRRTLAVPDPVATAPAPPAAQPAETPPPRVVLTPPRPKAPPRPKPAPPASAPEDPTKKALAEIAGATAREIEATRRLDERAAGLEKARAAAVAGADGWRRREMLVKQQLSSMVRQAEKIDRDVDELAAQRDVLARERDALKAALAKAPGQGSFAVLPYKGENGTWRRPIVMECTNGSVTLRPNGPTFSMLDLSGLINPRSSPVIVAIARELLKIQGSASPDGSPVAPYFVFLVRPDGIRPYYEARARLEPLGIAFGYELIDQDLKVDVPDFDNLATWDGSTPIDVPPSNLAGLGSGSDSGSGTGVLGGGPEALGGRRSGGGSSGLGEGGGLAWPGASGGSRSPSGSGSLAGSMGAGRSPRRQGGNGDGTGGGRSTSSPDDFVWPSGRGGGGGIGSAGEGAWSGGQALGGRRGDGTSPTGGDRGSEGGPGDGHGFGSGAKRGAGSALALDQLPSLEPAEPTTRQDVGRPAGASGGSAPGAKPGTDFGLSAGEGLKALAAGVDAGRTQGSPAARGSENGTDTAPGGFRSTGAPGSTGSLAGRSAAAGRASPALEAAPATGSAPGAATSEPGLMWGGRSPGTNAGAGSTEASEAANGSGAGSSSTSGSRALVGLGDGRGSPPSGSRVPIPTGSMGVGLGSLSSLAALGASPSSSSESVSGADAGGSASNGGGSGLTLGSTSAPSGPSSGSGSKDLNDLEPSLKSKTRNGPSPPIEVPFEMVVACGADGLVVHPGGYRITAHSLKEERKDSLLIRQLVAVAVQRAETDPSIRPKPRVKFLVENDGGSTFWEARRQVLFAGLDWPMTLQVTGTQNPRLLDRESW